MSKSQPGLQPSTGTTQPFPPPSSITYGAPTGPGFFGQGQQFLQGLLSGQLPPALLQQAQRNLRESQGALNSQLQLRGGFYGTPGLQLQNQLAENFGTGLNALMFQNAMQAIPQGLGLYSGAAGLAGLPSQPSPAFGAGLDLLGALRGGLAQPMYAPDPLMQILGAALPLFQWTF